MIFVWVVVHSVLNLFVRKRGRVVAFLCFSLGISVQAMESRNFADLSIEELLNESVTSVSKREQKLRDAAAAIAVFSNDDLRRSGAMNIADALRLVPGLNVASVNSSQWSVSARGFNNLYANKLLVLVDGRAVYSPLFAGVYWEMQQPFFEDLDHIEVIRGPGASVWGANAVNGVINIESLSAKDTQGTILVGGAGDADVKIGGLRHGGVAGANTYYRVFANYQANDSHLLPDGREAGDGWQSWHAGARVDHYPSVDTHVTWQADGTETRVENGTADGYNFNALGRLTQKLAGAGSIEVQAYLDRLHRDETLRSRSTFDSADISFQHTLPSGELHDVIWGGGYRFHDVTISPTNPAVTINTGALDLNLFSLFVQDQLKVIPERLTVTGGIKFEHNDFTGFETQPSLRAAWKPVSNQTAWVAVARSVRTPSAVEARNIFLMQLGAPIPGPDGGLYVPTGVGNENPDAEVLLSYELGWRVQIGPKVSVDVATFYNDYKKLILIQDIVRFIPGVPVGRAEMPFMNFIDANTYGGEIALMAAPSENWRLNLSHSVLLNQSEGAPSGIQYDPEHQTVLRSTHFLGSRTNLDLQVRQVGGFAVFIDPTGRKVPGYTAFDARLSYHPSDSVELSLVGQNLFDPQHAEQGVIFYALTTEVPRRVHAKLTLRF